jgi:phage gp36-like protein
VATYATLAQLAKNAPPGSIQDLDDPTKQEALDAFSAEVDTYLRGQYTLPLTEPYDPALVRHTCAGAVWQLMGFKGFNPEIASNEIFEKNHKRAIEWLTKLARGDASLAIEADASTTRLGGARVSTSPRRGW